MNEENFGRHPNGNGKIFGFAEADAATKLDKHSAIHDEVQIYNSLVINSIIRGNAVIHDATIRNSLIDGNAMVLGALVADSQVTDNARVIGKKTTSVNHSTIGGKARIFGEADIFHATILDASIYGDAFLEGQKEKLYFQGQFRIGTGKWIDRLPRIYRFSGMEISLTESTDGYAYIGCWRMKMEEWIKKGNKLGKKHGWKPESVEIATLIFKEWMQSPITQKSSN